MIRENREDRKTTRELKKRFFRDCQLLVGGKIKYPYIAYWGKCTAIYKIMLGTF